MMKTTILNKKITKTYELRILKQFSRAMINKIQNMQIQKYILDSKVKV